MCPALHIGMNIDVHDSTVDDWHVLHAAEPTQAKPTTKLASKAKSMKDGKRLTAGMRTLLASHSFQAITFASALNDVGSWALVSWHATFYTRTFGIGPDIYAPMLAAIIPIGGDHWRGGQWVDGGLAFSHWQPPLAHIRCFN
jgi:hypothetical protein